MKAQLFDFFLVAIMSTETSIPKVRLIPSTRFTLALLVSFALFIQYAQRVSLSMSIVCMINRTTTDNASKFSAKYGSQFLNDKKFAWTEFQQQILLGAYWFGYIFTLIPSNRSETVIVYILLTFVLNRWLAVNHSGCQTNVCWQSSIEFDCNYWNL